MRCRFCGAEVKEGSNTCEYCGSAVEKEASRARVIIKDSGKPQGSIVKMIVRGIIILACIFAAVIVISLITVLNSDVFKEHYEASLNTTPISYKLPGNESALTGKVIICDSKGMASIEYEDVVYENVKILDKDLIAWLNDTDRMIDNVGICFTTDENGDISELGLRSPGFFVMEKEAGRYIAVREENVISFTSEIPLKTECYYGGYFSYPDMRLYSAEEEKLWAMTYMDVKCEEKESVSMQEYYTEEEITVYKIFAKGEWYYCGKDTYDAIETGDLLNGYQMCTEDGLSFLIKE